jgi:hypothetical protein
MWERMQNLKKETVEAKLSPFLTKKEMEGLLKRNKALVKHIKKLIKKHGEKGVIFQFWTG